MRRPVADRQSRVPHGTVVLKFSRFIVVLRLWELVWRREFAIFFSQVSGSLFYSKSEKRKWLNLKYGKTS
jgi:hypothetical protein